MNPLTQILKSSILRTKIAIMVIVAVIMPSPVAKKSSNFYFQSGIFTPWLMPECMQTNIWLLWITLFVIRHLTLNWWHLPKSGRHFGCTVTSKSKGIRLFNPAFGLICLNWTNQPVEMNSPAFRPRGSLATATVANSSGILRYLCCHFLSIPNPWLPRSSWCIVITRCKWLRSRPVILV